ncbi:TMEM165/GDT1 family protein [Candidatus Contubernalis alkaliaceticus]|uniref:TMEM165/GDT1 family protein n=1 Tax=Candidatus Contubernalis alkaliaceticus TaxID=338645 RepID=UPI001F4C14C8|nr:TMEM165/GDT1 family protein [Candidatus Contubernalis alkalaceticus]UNC92247.1 TMEM165/GDT1 family protein [Candidatus Contubernalis alkalaceticus]
MFTAFFTTFLAVLFAELGDKSQFITLTLSSRYTPLKVFWGVMMSLSILTAMGIGLGHLISDYLRPDIIAVVSGTFFIVMGLYTYYKKEQKDELKSSDRSAFTEAFITVFFAEMGDKTQFAVLAFSAIYQAPLPVFFGAMSAQAVNQGIAAFLGGKYLSKIPEKNLTYISTGVFLFFGLLILWQGLALF